MVHKAMTTTKRKKAGVVAMVKDEQQPYNKGTSVGGGAAQ
jgi:hypothetical protein